MKPDQWPLYGLERVERCPICASEDRTLQYRDLTDRTFFTAPGKWIVFQCGNCGSAYMDPRPTEATIGLAYTDYFTHSVDDSDSLRGTGLYHRMRRSLANGYRNRRFGVNRQPSIALGYWVARLLPGMRPFLDGEMRHIPRPVSGETLLDVGCGNGEFLVKAWQAGWQVEGVEPDPDAVRVCTDRGLDVRQGTILDVPGSSRLDGITMCHVIEHVHDPRGVLKVCADLLRPGGWLWIETPNVNSLCHRKFKSDWLGLDPPRHLTVFNRSSLFGLLSETGFTEIRDMPCRPQYVKTARASRSIRLGSGVPDVNGPSRADRWILSPGEWVERFWKNGRETIVVRARKPF